ncbi:MAG TPA: STAS domain-containing protein [Gemmataceae bacterium]|nr:STAS domain-containing protein [Gemmataceae bacterium]
MNNLYRHIQVETRGDVFCVRLRDPRMDETAIFQFAEELVALAKRDGCRKLALSLGPVPPDCLYSVFLAKLVMVQRVHNESGGEMVLCDVAPPVKSTFDATQLDRRFTFVPDFGAAVARWSGPGT